MGILAALKKMSAKLKTFFTKLFSKSSGEEASGPEPTINAFVLGEMGGDDNTKEDDNDKKREDDDDEEQKKKEDDESPLDTSRPFQTEEGPSTISSTRWGLPGLPARKREATVEEERANALLESMEFLPTIKATNASTSLCSLVEEEEEKGGERRGRSGRRRGGSVVRGEGVPRIPDSKQCPGASSASTITVAEHLQGILSHHHEH